MKRILSVVLALVFALAFAAFSEDYTAYTMEELMQMQEAISKEIARRQGFEKYSYDWYQMPDVQKSGETFLMLKPLENPVPVLEREDFSGGYGWMYSFLIELADGQCFMPARVVCHLFSDNVVIDEYLFEDNAAWMVLGTDVLYEGYTGRFNGGMPLQNVQGIGFSIEGEDANGETLVFRCYAEFSKELPE